MNSVISAARRIAGTAPATALSALVYLYQGLSAVTPGSCRHEPSCSHYALEALKRHGALRGGWLTVRRLLRCHPWGTWGYDPVPPATARDGCAGSVQGRDLAGIDRQGTS